VPGSGFVLVGSLPATMNGWRIGTEPDRSGYLRPLDIQLTALAVSEAVAMGTLNSLSDVERSPMVEPSIEAPQRLSPVHVDGEEHVIDMTLTKETNHRSVELFTEEIAAIMKPARLEVAVLRRTPSFSVGDSVCEIGKHVELMTYFALNDGSVPMKRCEREIWGEDAATNTSSSAVSRLRAWLKSHSGEGLIPAEPKATVYEVRECGSDIGRFHQLSRLSLNAPNDTEKLRCFDTALGLVPGEPCSDVTYGWYTGCGHQGRIQSVVSDTAVAAARLARELGDATAALRYVEIGKAASRHNQSLRMQELEAFADLGRPDGVESAFAESARVFAELRDDVNIGRIQACYEYAQLRSLRAAEQTATGAPVQTAAS
jgi:hypothetical protein